MYPSLIFSICVCVSMFVCSHNLQPSCMACNLCLWIAFFVGLRTTKRNTITFVFIRTTFSQLSSGGSVFCFHFSVGRLVGWLVSVWIVNSLPFNFIIVFKVIFNIFSSVFFLVFLKLVVFAFPPQRLLGLVTFR